MWNKTILSVFCFKQQRRYYCILYMCTRLVFLLRRTFSEEKKTLANKCCFPPPPRQNAFRLLTFGFLVVAQWLLKTFGTIYTSWTKRYAYFLRGFISFETTVKTELQRTQNNRFRDQFSIKNVCTGTNTGTFNNKIMRTYRRTRTIFFINWKFGFFGFRRGTFTLIRQ